MGQCWSFDDVRRKHEEMHMQIIRPDDDETADFTLPLKEPLSHASNSSFTLPPIQTLTSEDVELAYKLCQRSSLVRRTPVLREAQVMLDLNLNCKLHLKLETLQCGGSHEIRGVVHQFATTVQESFNSRRSIVGIANRNYILAFALVSFFNGYRTYCLMPQEAALETVVAVKKLGIQVTKVPNESLLVLAKELEKDPSLLVLYPDEDYALITGYSTVGFEILEDVTDVDIVVVGCGSGTLLAGIAAAVKLIRPEVQVYGVEPENACNVYDSLREGRPISNYKYRKTIALSLAWNRTGPLTFTYCRQYADGIIRVSEEEITYATVKLYLQGLVADPSACASLAACLAHKIPQASGKVIVAVLTSRNMTTRELFRLPVPTVLGVSLFPKTKGT